MKTSRLSIFNAYNYYHVAATKRNLNNEELQFMNFCMDNHDIICSENTNDNDPIIQQASKLYCEIE